MINQFIRKAIRREAAQLGYIKLTFREVGTELLSIAVRVRSEEIRIDRFVVPAKAADEEAMQEILQIVRDHLEGPD